MSQAIDWHPTLEQILTTLRASAATVGSIPVTYFAGELNVSTDFCPLGVVWAGDADYKVVPLGRAATGRYNYRETKTFLILLATYKMAKQTEDSVWENAHAQMEDLIKLVLDALTTDTTLNGNVLQSFMRTLRKDPPEAPEDETLQVARIELQVIKNWY